jgi:hypothetical protein
VCHSTDSAMAARTAPLICRNASASYLPALWPVRLIGHTRRQHRDFDVVCRGVANRVSGEIDDVQLPLMDGMNGIAERLFDAIRNAGYRFQADPHAVRRETDDRWQRITIPFALDALGRKSEADAELSTLEESMARGCRPPSLIFTLADKMRIGRFCGSTAPCNGTSWMSFQLRVRV